MERTAAPFFQGNPIALLQLSDVRSREDDWRACLIHDDVARRDLNNLREKLLRCGRLVNVDRVDEVKDLVLVRNAELANVTGRLNDDFFGDALWLPLYCDMHAFVFVEEVHSGSFVVSLRDWVLVHAGCKHGVRELVRVVFFEDAGLLFIQEVQLLLKMRDQAILTVEHGSQTCLPGVDSRVDVEHAALAVTDSDWQVHFSGALGA